MHGHHKEKEKIWFKRKTYGWGWVPASWEGWAVLIIYGILMVWMFSLIDVKDHSASDTLTNFVIRSIVLSVVLIGICYVKGEEPKWTWGDDHDDVEK